MRPRSNNVFNVSHMKGLISLTHNCVCLTHLMSITLNTTLQTHLILFVFVVLISQHRVTSFSRFKNERKNLLLIIEGIIPNIFIGTDTSIKQILLMAISSGYILFTKSFETTFFTGTLFVTYILIIFVFKLIRFFFFVLFYPHFIFCQYLVSSKFTKFYYV